MNEDKVVSFIDSIEQKKNNELKAKAFQNSLTYKRKCLDDAKRDAKNICLAKVFEKFYTDAVPLNDEYKCAYHDGLCTDVHNFAQKRTDGKDLIYYIGEAIKAGSVPAKRIMESVTKLVDEAYEEREFNIKNLDKPEDYVFKMDDDTVERIDAINQDLELDDLANVISDNVKTTATSEIQRARQEKENMKQIESELANDLSVQSEAAIERALELRGINKKKIYQPSIFEGIMIGNLNKNSILGESTDAYLYGTLEDYGFVTESGRLFATPEELSFVESVRELTLLNMAKSLRLEKFTIDDLRNLANEYASN